MVTENILRLTEILRTSGRLRDEDQALMARALVILLGNRSAYPEDPTEALVQALATIAVVDAAKGTT